MGKVIRVDIDGVLVTEETTFERALAQPIDGAKKKLKDLKNLGYTIILETARGWAEYKMTVNQLMRYNIEYDLLLMGKPIVDYSVDDRAIKFENWEQAYLDITSNDEDAYALYAVRQGTARFLRSLYLHGHTFEISPMVKAEMPHAEPFYVEPSEYAKGTYQYCGNDAQTKDFFRLNSITPEPDHIVAVNVLEHMEQVWNFPHHCKLLKAKHVHIFVPYSLRFHGPAPDLWRFTDTGLKHLMSGWKCTRLDTYGPDTKPYGIGASFEAV